MTRFTTTDKLWLGIGTLAALVIVVAITIAAYPGRLMRGPLAVPIGQEPIGRAATEMERKIDEIAVLALRDAAGAQARDDAALSRSISGFEDLKARFDATAPAEYRAAARQIGSLFAEFSTLASTLNSHRSVKRAQLQDDVQRFVELRRELRNAIDAEIRQLSDAQWAVAKGSALLVNRFMSVVVLVSLTGTLAIGIGTALVVSREVREQRNAQARLQAQQLFLQAVMDNVADSIVACDANGAVTLCNRATRELYGFPDRPITLKLWPEQYELYYADGQTAMDNDRTPLARALQGEHVRDLEMIVAHSEQPQRIMLASGQPLQDADGNRLGAVVSMRDITQRRQAEEVLRRVAQELQRSNRELQQFALIASHDLQEPLRKIQAFGDRLQAQSSDALGESGRDHVQRMQSAAARMRTLIDGLLSFARVTSKAQPFQPVDLVTVAQQVISDLEGRIAQSRGKVEIGALPVIEADALQMRQLLQNLIGNGLKFHRSGTAPAVRIEAQLVGEDDASPKSVCELIVQDNGIGFEQDDAERIFDVFQRLHGRQEYEGTGMGLAICRRIVERHGGAIAARSKPGRGATFIVTLPATQPAHEAVAA